MRAIREIAFFSDACHQKATLYFGISTADLIKSSAFSGEELKDSKNLQQSFKVTKVHRYHFKASWFVAGPD